MFNRGGFCNYLSDKRIKWYYQRNGGAGAARNMGIEQARGSYLYFCDPDDIVNPLFLEKLVMAAAKSCADVVVADYVEISEVDGSVCPRLNIMRLVRQFHRFILMPDDMLRPHVIGMIRGYLWNKLFKRSFVEEHRLRLLTCHRFEDVYFTYLSLIYSKKIALLPFVGYGYYLGRKGSLMNSFEKNDNSLSYSYQEMLSRLNLDKLDGKFSDLIRSEFDRHNQSRGEIYCKNESVMSCPQVYESIVVHRVKMYGAKTVSLIKLLILMFQWKGFTVLHNRRMIAAN